ncbi:MAG: hypothetical protein RSE31_04880 [Anaerovoracaceae bacterium]
MDVTILEQKMSREQAMKIALKKGDWFWNLVFHSKPLGELKLLYVEYIIFDIETKSTPGIFHNWRMKSQYIPTKKNVQVLVNGSTGGVSLITDKLNLIEKEFDDSVSYQNTSFSDDEVIIRAKKLVQKITHRTMGGLHEAKIVEYMSIYRPFWVAYYGKMQEGNKVRYITIPADGGHNSRAR